MSTYTDYRCERKENITILRKPNCPEFDGFTPQKVIFGNEANIFKGSFYGKLSAQDMVFNGAEINNAKITGGILLDTKLCSDGQLITIPELTTQVSEHDADIEQIKLDILSINTNISNISSSVDTQLSTLSSQFTSYVNDMVETSCEYISTELTNTINNISTEITSNINTISIDLSNEIINRISNDTYISSNLSTLSNEFINHVEQNKEDFEYLTEYMLSTVEHDKHYQFYYSNNIISSVPYKLHNFGINIVQDSVSNVKLICDNVEIGYATKFTDAHDNQCHYINLYIDSSNFDKFDEILPDEYNETLELNKPKQIQYGSELYTIEYSNSTGTELIYIKSNANDYIKLYNINNEWIGSIIDYKLESNKPSLKILSGQLQLRYNPNAEIFNEFYDLFKSIEFNNSDDKRCHMVDDFRISFNYDDQTFTFEKHVKAERFVRVINNDTSLNNIAELGIIYEKDCNTVENEIQSFTFNGIKQFGNVTLTKENNYFDFSSISNYIIQFDNTSKTINISSANTYYEYEFSSSDGKIYGSLIPSDGKQILNTDSNISVTISAKIPSGDDIIVVPNTYELVKRDNIWIYEVENNNIQYANGQLLIKGNLGNISYATDDGVYSIDVYNGEHKYSNAELVATSRPIDFNFNNGDIEYISPEEYRYTSIIDDDITYVNVNNNLPYIEIHDIPEDYQYVQYEIPTLENKYNDCSREFIIASNIKSNGNVKIKFFDSDKKQITNISSDTEFGILTQPANKLVVMKVNEVEPNGFFVTYSTNDHLLANINKLSSDLSTEIIDRISSDEYLSTQFDIKLSNEISTRIKIDNELSAAISSNITSINDIRKNIRGGLNYQDTLCIDIDYSDGKTINTISGLIFENISIKTKDITDIQIESLRLREGFFYVLVADKKTYRRDLDGHELEYGDWLIIKNNTILSDLTSADVNIFDAQDYDSFRLSSDNIATGKNIFTGEISIDNNAFIKQISSLNGSIDNLSVKLNTSLSSNIEHISATHANIEHINISNLTSLNSDLSNAGISNLTANSISSENIDIVSAGISNLIITNANAASVCISNLTTNNISSENVDIISAGISNLTVIHNNTVNAIISDITATNTTISNAGISNLTANSISSENIDIVQAGISNLTANVISSENVDIVSAGISNLTANSISSENVDIVSAGISNLTASNVNFNTGTITSTQIAKLSATDAELINTTASMISIDFGKLINTNTETSSRYPNALSLINKIELSVDGISSIIANEISNTVRYFGNLNNAYNTQNTLTGFLHDNFNNLDAYKFRKGFQYRITNTCILSDNISVNTLNKNDYIIFNSNAVLSNVTWNNIDIIRDSEVECKILSDLVFDLSSDLSTLSGELCATSSLINISAEGISASVSELSNTVLSISSDLSTLSTSVSSLSTTLTSNIDYLSSELSDYHNTLSGIDRINHTSNVNHKIVTDNLMITDVTEISESGEHPKYYMTMLSGTLVLKRI